MVEMAKKESAAAAMGSSLKRHFVVEWAGRYYCTGRQWQIGDDKQVQDVFSIHEHDLAASRLIKLATDPVPRCLGNLATRHDKGVIDQNAPAQLGIEDLVPEHHGHLVVHL